MATFRVGVGSFNIQDGAVGFGTDTDGLGNLRVKGVTKTTGSIVSGASTLTRYAGFAADNINQLENITLTTEVGTIGDIVVGVGTSVIISSASTVTVGTVESVSIGTHFSPPKGGIEERGDNFVEGMMRFNTDLNTMEFYNGNEWRQFTYISDVQNSPSSRGRGLFGGGQPGPSSKIDSIEIMSQGNGVDFGSLINANANKIAYANSIRGIFVGGSSSGTDMDYVTIASRGNGVDFGNLTQSRAYGGGASSSTRGLAIGGWAGSNPPSNVIDYVEIMTIGNALDFGDLFTGRYNHSSFSSPTRAFAYAGVNNNNGTSEISIEVVTIASKGNATDFGDAAARANATLCGSSSSTRGIMGGGYSGPAITKTVQYLTMSTTGSAQIFGDLTSARQRPGGASTQTRSVFYGGATDGNDYTIIDFITIATTGNAQDFGDVNDKDNYTKAGLSDSHGGLGGY